MLASGALAVAGLFRCFGGDRAEAFNLLNKTNFAPASGSFNSTSFGTITQTFPARQIQFALKLVF